MNKINKISKYVDLFCKKALNRRERLSFLKALAQEEGSRLTAQIRSGLESLVKDLAAIKPNSQDLQNKLMDFINLNTENKVFSKQDLVQLNQSVRSAKQLISDPQHSSQAEKAAELEKMIDQLAFVPNEPAESPIAENEPYGPSLTGGFSSEPVSSTTPAKKPATPPSFPKDVQEKLNEMLSDLAVQGKVFHTPFKATGFLDANTLKALNNWRKYMNMQKASLKELVDNIKQYHGMVFKPNA